jgi:hypothetical protein
VIRERLGSALPIFRTAAQIESTLLDAVACTIPERGIFAQLFQTRARAGAPNDAPCFLLLSREQTGDLCARLKYRHAILAPDSSDSRSLKPRVSSIRAEPMLRTFLAELCDARNRADL